ncbi:glycosyltransferase family 61 protein [Coraliomargarita sp. W4R53]
MINLNKLRTVLKRGAFKTLVEKASAQAVNWIPHKSGYRPDSVVDVRGGSDDFEVDCVDAGSVSETFLPQGFKEVMIDKGYDLFDLEVDPPRMYSSPIERLVVRVPSGRILSDNLKVAAYITRQNQLLSDVSFQYVGESVEESRSPVFRRRFFQDPVKLQGRVLSLIAGGVSGRGNYFHWLIDVLPRLQTLADSRFAGSVDYVIVPQYQRDFQKMTLQLMGISAEQIVECGPFSHFECEELLVTTHPRGKRSILVPDWVFSLYGRIKQEVLTTGDFPKKIYVTRLDTKLRGVKDEERLIEFLKTYGYEPVTLAEHDFDGKVNLFHAAESVISAHGAGLTNLIFSRPGTRLLELFSEGFIDPVFVNLAERRELVYSHLVFGNPNAAFEDAKGQYEDIIIDYATLEKKLQSFES